MAYLSMGEAHRRITEYLNRFSDAVSYQNGISLKSLFSLSSNSHFLLSLSDALILVNDFNRLINQNDNYSHFSDIISPLFRSLQHYKQSNFVEAYNAFEKTANAFVQEFRNWESAWALEAVYVVVYEIRVLAEKADRQLAAIGKSPEKLKGAGSLLMKVFGILAVKGAKRVGALYVTCQLFKIYFKLGTVNLCRSIIRSIETATTIFDFEEFPNRDKVTYMYYTGRLEVFNENFPSADYKLSYALKHCNQQHEANIRMILKYLIPVKLSIGILPNHRLLEKYNLLEYGNIVQALKRGDPRLLRSALQYHEDWFLRSGVYLVLEKVELQVYQRLVKKIYIIQKQRDPSRAHQVKLEVIVKALKWLEIDMDVDEVECIMAILIYKNLVKGYFAHKSKVAVLSKQDPFPKLNGKPVNS
ncbi:putative proteasome component (PCI) domain-containing protein [Medicago truncatula]|uniref:Proteasome-like protein n=1 Tax=Medicago truncatula TaxID=3880 RepID=A0A072UCR5_MEDTR|nr:enhanced ethylene response protein 5 [Medicago truncatula]KEH23645.1 proteasome-like protein [Medicago truncatula]RHN47865.1 putative proteasome component (PCI) domain-containing protein [Medicago truncatula]